MIVHVGRSGIAGGIRFHPLDAVLHQRPHGFAGVLHSVDDEDQAFHADLPELGIPIHEPARAADLASAAGKAGSGNDTFVDRLFHPDVDVVEATAAAGGGIAAFEGEPGVGSGEEGDVLDRVFNIEVGKFRDVEIGQVDVGLDQARKDGPTPDIDHPCVRRDRFGDGGGGPGKADAFALDPDHGIRNGRGTGTVDQASVGEDERAGVHEGMGIRGQDRCRPCARGGG